ncbi:aldehyde dehydrogenase family protein [Rhizobium rhizogenes]|uniref:aldehyde dehydrogenase family protein n=1 Tax=Rhizobium rhizogenes TaxID=359 RepID=UPI001574BC55|nr:aldehyde dehydrogenase family protein [Rhizobium rhizogenes]NTH23388.1 aldehyde dehydrogenase family protein [Rhizobium rhizogenes]NTH32879.1 aldehyde dehydrogenase family protein [Rhizobium rhizogenes]
MQKTDFYIDGAWVQPARPHPYDIVSPSDGTISATISLGSADDVDRAVAAARRAFEYWSQTDFKRRVGLLERLQQIYAARSEEMAQVISLEMGAPITFARQSQADAGRSQISNFLAAAKEYQFEHAMRVDGSGDQILHEPIGVCGLITPWNWPINQITLKVVPALLAGCTVVLKPSEIAPLSAMLFAEMIDEAGYPAGVFNLVNGDGATVGEAISGHPGIDMVSFTGSTRAGVAVMKRAAETVKRVTLELGGKSPNVVFADVDIEETITRGARACFSNAGQSCNAPTRMLVERPIYEKAVALAVKVAHDLAIGAPNAEGPHIGPVISMKQFDKIQGLIQAGIAEGARLAAGGPGRPEGLATGAYVRPTVFADVDNDMTIAREEIFGPVLCIIPFDSEAEAIRIANDTPYGLNAQVQSKDLVRARRVARAIRSGMVQINGASRASGSPFGGVKQSGNGREGGIWGIEEYLETKSVSGWG